MKPHIRKDIRDAGLALESVMKLGVAQMMDSVIDKVMKNYRNMPYANRYNATKDVTPKGINDYKSVLSEAFALVASESLKDARKEVPTKVKLGWADSCIQLGEYERLPTSVRKRIDSQIRLIVGAQVSDVEKILFFQYGSSVDSTDSEETIRADMKEAADDYIEGNAIRAGATTSASRVVNEARAAYFFDDEVLDEVDAFEFVNGDPVSPICQELAGTIFSKDDPELARYQPPLHWNCKSYILPILKGNLGKREIEKAAPSAEARASIQFSETPDEIEMF